MEDQPNVTRRKPSRFRPLHSFSLRTLLIGVALLAALCGYVAHEAKIVQDRRVWAINHGHFWVTNPLRATVERVSGDPSRGPSFVRLWLGDKPLPQLVVPTDTEPSEIKLAASLFPEADIFAAK
jgi:hypothetical protein